MEVIEKIIVQETEPAIQRNVAWLNPTDKDFKVYINGEWVQITEEAELTALKARVQTIEGNYVDSTVAGHLVKHVWKGTQAEYEAMTSYDANTLYVTTED